MNTCIDRIYKQVPTRFRKSLDNVKIAKMRPENPGPLRTYSKEAITRQRKQSGLNTRRSVSVHSTNGDLLKTVLTMNKKLPLHKLASKTIQKRGSTYKHRHGGSGSLSSLNSSLYKRGGHYYYPRASKLRHFYAINPLTNVNNKPKVVNASNTVNLPSIPLRKTHTIRNPNESLNTFLTKHIKNDLMVIDNAMKKRLNGLHVPSTQKPLQLNLLEFSKRDELLVAEEAIKQQYKYLDTNNLIRYRYRTIPKQRYDSFCENEEIENDHNDYQFSKNRRISRQKQIRHFNEQEYEDNYEKEWVSKEYKSIINNKSEPKREETMLPKFANEHLTSEKKDYDSDDRLDVIFQKDNDLSVKEQEMGHSNNNTRVLKLNRKPYVKISSQPNSEETTLKMNLSKLKSNSAVKPMKATKVQNLTKPTKPLNPMKSLLYQKGMPSATLMSAIMNRPVRVHHHY